MPRWFATALVNTLTSTCGSGPALGGAAFAAPCSTYCSADCVLFVLFAPATPLRCTPSSAELRQLRSHWRTTAWGCELEVVFLAHGVPMLEPLWRFHNVRHSGCAAAYPTFASVPNNSMIMVGPGFGSDAKWSWKDANGTVKKLHSSKASAGERYRDGMYACTS